MFFKFIFDRVLSLLALILILPIFIIIILLYKLNKLDGTVFFNQERVGQFGKLFTIYKFRTMIMSDTDSSISLKGESRITSYGAFLRKHKLDELPGLWNVFKGDMSFVGPRPDVPGYADKLQGNARKILLIKPGLSGPASIKYRNEEELLSLQNNPKQYNDEVIFPDKVRINLNYIEHWSFSLDIKIIIYTLLNKELQEPYFK